MRAARLVVLLAVFPLAGCGSAAGESLSTDIRVDETLAMSHLGSIREAEIQFRALGVVDTDGDGVGEFGSVGELSGAERPRGPGAGLKVPLLGDEFQRPGPRLASKAHGYLFRVFLPAAGADGAIPADDAETRWWACAWPVEYGRTGRRTFVVTPDGGIFAKDDASISGEKAPEADVVGTDGTVRADFKPVR